MRLARLILVFAVLMMNQALCVAQSASVVPTESGAASRSGKFSGKVVSVTDGDTIDVLYEGSAERIRLNGIDCPEKRQPFGDKAKQFAAAQCFDKTVTVTRFGRDRYGRTIGDVALPDGRVLNEELVRNGYAWWFRKYAPDNKKLEELEQGARERKLGLWRDAQPVPPWAWRKRHWSGWGH